MVVGDSNVVLSVICACVWIRYCVVMVGDYIALYENSATVYPALTRRRRLLVDREHIEELLSAYKRCEIRLQAAVRSSSSPSYPRARRLIDGTAKGSQFRCKSEPRYHFNFILFYFISCPPPSFFFPFFLLISTK